ncbi:MAG: glutamine-hydrolyzing GMP synthase [Candidatus Staskawiczbacteria bacterium]|jgi:GMP synthase (glutamine-hydrolysing)
MIHTLKKVDEQALCEIDEEKAIRKTKELFLLFSLGSQFDHLIKQALEKLGVFCLVADPSQVRAADVKKVGPTGMILSGGPVSVYQDFLPFDKSIFDLGIPVLGICLGFQLWAHHIGCSVKRSTKREFGTHKLSVLEYDGILAGCEDGMPVLESHGDMVEKLESLTPRSLIDEFFVLGRTENSPVAVANYKHLWGVQFHPEVTETTKGLTIFSNFCFGICGANDRYPAEKVSMQKIATLREKIGDKKVLLALSGGSDSSTVAYLLKAALSGKNGQLRAVYIRGVDRPDDEAHVFEYFANQEWVELKVIDATDRFLDVLRGKETMKEKRVAMRGVYKDVLEEEIMAFGASFIAQGTLYTDISESGKGYATKATKAQIKLHHNVGLEFSVEELTPLDDCVKDTGRDIGRSVGVPESLLVRQPFPGTGLIVRIEGEITADKLKIARQIDDIYIKGLREQGLYDGVWQAGAVVTQSITTCTKGDDAVSGVVVALWAVWSVNGFTAQAAELPWDFIKRISQRITNEIREVGAVVYRTSDKPPATIEWG